MPAIGTHSGAGRITPVRLRDLLQGESLGIHSDCPLGLNEYVDLILASGFPGFQRLSGDPLNKQLDGCLSRIVDADMREAGSQHRKPATVMAWRGVAWRGLAPTPR